MLVNQNIIATTHSLRGTRLRILNSSIDCGINTKSNIPCAWTWEALEYKMHTNTSWNRNLEEHRAGTTQGPHRTTFVWPFWLRLRIRCNIEWRNSWLKSDSIPLQIGLALSCSDIHGINLELYFYSIFLLLSRYCTDRDHPIQYTWVLWVKLGLEATGEELYDEKRCYFLTVCIDC